VSGKFTADQALVFTAVLSAQRAVAALLRPGVSWVDCHRAAERAILTTLTEGGLLTGDVEEMIEAVLGPVFFPHGLGHLIGCDTHDVGGYRDFPSPYPPSLTPLISPGTSLEPPTVRLVQD
jgi:Xaa-Pro dipeptidase